ncbi:putative The fantastic four family protein [Medicago truncatula]|uniref:Putative The fantastic four family protein n=1 Tax=Medicago truncatula TaxID=3880 RepID=A0A396JZH0_MEDTR|nr:protein FANTASTIC FOUR 3 [Medicago truncatula]RHN82071.1 putative The fantastic four family protein [Medicago truncatula]
MAAIVYHPGLQSHLESHLVESRTVRLRLPSPKQVPTPQSVDLAFKSCLFDSNIKTHHHEENINKTETFQNKSNNNGGWNFLDALSNNIAQNTSKKETTTATYLPPQQKCSSLVLSPKSLELCTENLGNESGTDIVENDLLLSSMGTMEQRQPCSQVLAATKKVKTQNFPPPLTTIRGSESLHVRTHRGDGRLVIEVTKVPPSTSCFQADRSHGCLRLYFLTNETTSFDPEEEQEEDGEVDADDENEQLQNEDEFSENEMIGGEIQNADKETKENKSQGVFVASECEGMKLRMESRVRRSKEGGENENNESLNWGENVNFWVATTS